MGINMKPETRSPAKDRPSLNDADRVLFRRYQDAFHLAVYWPSVDNFRACVKAFDEMVEGVVSMAGFLGWSEGGRHGA